MMGEQGKAPWSRKCTDVDQGERVKHRDRINNEKLDSLYALPLRLAIVCHCSNLAAQRSLPQGLPLLAIHLALMWPAMLHGCCRI